MFILDRHTGVEGASCKECDLLTSSLLQSASPALRKKKGRLRGSKRPLNIEEEEYKDQTELGITEEEDEDWEAELDDNLNDPEDYFPENFKKPKIQSPSTQRTAKHFCPHDGCTLVFTTIQQMKTHLQSHDFVHCGRSAVICSSSRCSAVFHSQEELQEHLLGHNDKKHSCSICSKSFSTKQDLKMHSRTHSGEAHCSQCYTVPCNCKIEFGVIHFRGKAISM